MKRRLSWRQLFRWAAFYRIEPWGQPWLRSGRQTEIIRSSVGGHFDKHNEERFLITYQQGDEYRSKVERSPEEIEAKLARVRGLKMKKGGRRWQQLAKSRPSSPPRRMG